MYTWCASPGDGQTSCKVWLISVDRRRLSNEARRETRCNLLGCLKLANRSQPLVGRSSPYYKDVWRIYCCLTSFFSDCRYVPYLRRYSPTKLCNGAQVANFWRYFASCIFTEPLAPHFRPAFKIRTKATPCVEVWQTSSLRRLRLGEEIIEEEEEEQQTTA